MEKIAIYNNGKVVLGWAKDALINVDFVKNRITTTLNTSIVPHDFEYGFYWDKTPMGDEGENGNYLIVDNDFVVWNKAILLDEDKQAMENDTDELDEHAFVAVVNLVDETYFDVEEVCWKPII